MQKKWDTKEKKSCKKKDNSFKVNRKGIKGRIYNVHYVISRKNLFHTIHCNTRSVHALAIHYDER